MELTADNHTFDQDLMILHPPGHRERVLAIIRQAEELPGHTTKNCVFALEDAGYQVIVDGAFRVLEDGTTISDAEFALGPLEEEKLPA